MSSAQADDSFLELATRLAMIRGAKKDLATEEAEIREQILKIMEQADVEQVVTASGAPVISLTTQHRKTVNRSKLEALYPEVFDTVTEDTTAIVVKVHEFPL